MDYPNQLPYSHQSSSRQQHGNRSSFMTDQSMTPFESSEDGTSSAFQQQQHSTSVNISSGYASSSDQQQQTQLRPNHYPTMHDTPASLTSNDQSDAMDAADQLPDSHRRSESSPEPSSSDERPGIKYTKTGRISKALKGIRVHHCEQCNKSYTRAEHLRRHRLNHGGEMLPCDVEGCPRRFVREDLLLRHKEEQHSEHNQSNSGSRPPDSHAQSDEASSKQRTGSKQTSASQKRKAKQKDEPPQHQQQPQQQQQQSSHAPQDANSLSTHIITENRFANNTFDPSLQQYNKQADLAHWSWGAPLNPWDSRSYDSSSNIYDSPRFDTSTSLSNYNHFVNPPYQYMPPATFQSADYLPLPLNIDRSKSPASTTSGRIAGTWQMDDISTLPEVASSNTSDGSSYVTMTEETSDSYANLAMSFHTSLASIGYDRGNVITSVADLDVSEKRQIDQEFENFSLSMTHGHAGLQNVQKKLLKSYWTNFHPHFPVLHQVSFEMDHAPPLLSAFMMAVGASFLDDTCRDFASLLRETCLKLLRKRPNAPYIMYRLHDLHTILIAEVFSMYKSRRPVSSSSAQFERLYAELQMDHDVFSMSHPSHTSNLLTGYDKVSLELDEDVAQALRNQWLRIESKRRLFLACFVIDVQQSLYFGRTGSDSIGDIPLPCTQDLWDARSLQDWQEMSGKEPPLQFAFPDLEYLEQQHGSHDLFRSGIIVSCLTRNKDLLLNSHVSRILANLAIRSRNKLNYHMSMLSMHTPVRALLSIGGESFVLGEKLATRDQYMQAEIDLGAWLASEDVREALPHCMEIIRLACENDLNKGFPVIQEDYALYISALVIWACAIWSRRHQASVNNNGATPKTYAWNMLASDKTKGSLHEYIFTFLRNAEQAVSTSKPGNSGPVTLDAVGARAVVLFVRNCIQCRGIGGISQDAVTVLTRLYEARPVSSGTAAAHPS